jgi:DNA polymerase-3 subunit alpha
MDDKKPKRFVGLHAHTGFSTFDGLGYPDEHIDYVMETGGDALAITEHGHMNSYAHAQMYERKLRAKDAGFKFIPGFEAYYHPDLKQWEADRARLAEEKKEKKKAKADHTSTAENEADSKKSKWKNPLNRRHHMVLLAKSQKGLENIFTLVSRGQKEGFYRFPRIDLDMLKKHGQDVIISTACVAGPLASDIFSEFDVPWDELKPDLIETKQQLDSIVNKVENHVDRLIDCVGEENFNIELQFNELGAQHLANRVYLELAKKTGLPLIATADSHYCRPELWKDRELYRKLGWLNYENFDPSLLPQSIEDLKCELYPKNADQMWGAYKKHCSPYGFYDDQVTCDALERTWHIAHDQIGDVQPDVSMKLPSYVVPKGKTAFGALVEYCKEGLVQKGLHVKPQYVERLKAELRVIKDKNFAEYFLTMRAIMQLAQKRMLVGAGRGSSAGALACYVLGITQIDPIKYGLIFERFISRHRKEYPDVDSDVADRDELIGILKNEFGKENILPISNYNTFKLKSLVKDISRFYNISFKEVNDALRPLDKQVRKAVLKPGVDKNMFELKWDDALKHCETFRNFIDQHPEVAEHVRVLLKQNRSLGKHAGGVIISENIDQRMPVIVSKGEPQTPWVEGMHYKHLEHFGWIKFDLLGLETLRIINNTVSLILQRHHDIEDPSFGQIKEWYDNNLCPMKLDMDDERVYKYIYDSGRWAGIFQFTERGAQSFAKRSKPRSITDIAAVTSIFRPGPLGAKVDKTYIKAKRSPEEVVYEHPLIEECLKDTYGHIVFQEQLMQLGNAVGGLSLDDCDRLRKTLTKRSVSGASAAKQEAKDLEKMFIAGAQKNGISEQLAIELFEKMAYFSSYGFNKSLQATTEISLCDKNGAFVENRHIADVNTGDYVLSRDENTGINVPARVKNRHDHGIIDTYEFMLEDGKTIKCTMDHKFRTTDGHMLPMHTIIKENLDIVVEDDIEVIKPKKSA